MKLLEKNLILNFICIINLFITYSSKITITPDANYVLQIQKNYIQ